MKRSIFGACIMLAMASASFGQQTRFYLQEQGGAPGAFGNDAVSSITVGGTSVVVEAYVEAGPQISTGAVSTEWPCFVSSDIAGRPDIQSVPVSLVTDSLRGDWVFAGEAAAPAPDLGQCDPALACTNDADCSASSMCIDAGGTQCQVLNPRGAAAAFFGGTISAGVPEYIAEVEYSIPCEAGGNYTLRFVGCENDVNCDNVQGDAGTINTNISDSPPPTAGPNPIDQFDGLAFSIPVGDCCVGQACTPDVSECECNILGGSFRAGGDCSQDCECASDGDCNDGNACTTDTCIGQGAPGADGQGCLFEDTQTQMGQCCDTSNGDRAFPDDGNPCTADSCGGANGAPLNDPLTGDCDALVDPACSDGVGCTLDQCDAGVLQHIDLNTAVCTQDADCPAPSTGCDLGTGLCVCVENPPICLDTNAAANSITGQTCVAPGETLTVDVNVGQATEPLCGAQLFLSYDPSALEFVSITAGADADMSGNSDQYNTVLFLSVDEGAGTIDYAIGDDPFNGCDDANQGPSTIAQLTFNVIGECLSEMPLCFRDSNPPTFLGTAAGAKLIPTGCDGDPSIVGTCIGDLNATVGPELTCPFDGDQIFTSDCLAKTLTLEWGDGTGIDGISVSDDCEADLAAMCTLQFFPACENDGDCFGGTCDMDGHCTTALPGDQECNSQDLIAGGGTFCHGKTTISCSVTDKCKFDDSCEFSIINTAENLLTVDFELSPSMDPGNAFDPLTRCITAELSKCGDLGGEYFCTGGPLVGSACNPNNNGNPCPGQCELTNPSTFEVKTNVVIGQPDNIAGHGQLQAKVPVDNWDCLTLRDQWHTLRSSCAVACAADGSGLIATFKGSPLIADDPANGDCHWLINGNLNGDEHIDIIDFVAYLSADPTPGANRLCNEDEKPDNQGNGVIHADINGDGVVDIFDFSFIAINFFLDDKEDVCRVAVCGDEPAASTAMGSVSVADLVASGFTRADVQRADINNDGVVNLVDMSLHLNGSNTAGEDIQIDQTRLQAPEADASQSQSSSQFGTGFRR